MIQMKPDKEAFERICKELEQPYMSLTCRHLVDVFGWPAVELLILVVSPDENHKLVQLLEDIRDRIWIEKK